MFLRLASVVGFLLFVLFLKKLTLFINRPDLELKTTILLITSVLFLLGSWLLVFLDRLHLFEVSTLITSGGTLLTLVMYTYVLGTIKESLVSQE